MDLQEYQHRKTLTHHEHEKLSRFRKHMQKQMARKLAQIDRELMLEFTENLKMLNIIAFISL